MSTNDNITLEPDEINAMMQLLLKLDKKLDEQKSDPNIKYTNLNDKFDEQKNEIRNSLDIKFNEIKDEIKNRNTNLIRQCDIVISKLDEQLIQIENQKVSSSENMTKNEVLINKVSNSDNLNNEFTGSKKNMILENDNAVFECIESERELGESIFVKGDVYKRQRYVYVLCLRAHTDTTRVHGQFL